MKEHKIKLIVLIMTLSVVGLVAVQIFWLRSVIKIEEERFERKVNDALISVAEKIDKQEVAESVIKKIERSLKPHDKNFSKSKHAAEKIKDSVEHFALVITDSMNKPADDFQLRYLTRGNDSARITIINSDSILHRTVTINNNFKWQRRLDSFVVKRKQFVEDVVTDIIRVNTSKKIEERISNTQLNNFINSELKNKGIETSYYYGILKTSRDTLVLLKEGTNVDELKKSKSRTFLFPDEIFNSPNQLIVYFPEKNRYLLSSVSGLLALSIVLIVVITVVFYKTLQMFINQKKVTEIKNDLINNITHEFKTPISTISVACEALKEPDLIKESSSVDRYTSIIKEENERLRMMVETLLNTAAFEKGTLHLNKEPADINEIVKSSVSKFDEVLKKKNGKIYLELVNGELIFECDRFHFINSISNLIDNAIKYNDREPVIKIKTSVDNSQLKIEISDNGIGIRKDQTEKIFDTFYRVSTGNIHNVRGTGIGLSYCKKIVEAHNGVILLSSKPGEGSIFEIILPFK
jgi:two-component system phosphate regulon sensor histidine kinase PhoR